MVVQDIVELLFGDLSDAPHLSGVNTLVIVGHQGSHILVESGHLVGVHDQEQVHKHLRVVGLDEALSRHLIGVNFVSEVADLEGARFFLGQSGDFLPYLGELIHVLADGFVFLDRLLLDRDSKLV